MTPASPSRPDSDSPAPPASDLDATSLDWRDPFFELSPCLCATFEAGAFTRANQSWVKTLGWPPDELIGRHWADFIHPDDLDSAQGVERKMEAHRGLRHNHESRWRHADGSYSRLRWKALSYGKLTVAIGEEVASPGELAGRGEERLNQAQTLAEVGSYEIDDDSGQTHWSAQLLRMLGVTSDDERLAESPRTRFPVIASERITTAANQVRADGEPIQLEHRYRRGDELRWAESRIEPLLGDDGEPHGIVATMQDITGRRRAESESGLQAHMLKAIDACVIASDGAGVITLWNEGAERLYGWPAGDAIGRGILEVIAGPAERGSGEEIIRAVEEHGRWEGEFEGIRRDGSKVPVFLTLAAFSYPEGSGLMGVSIDISDAKSAKEDLAGAHDYLSAVIESMAEGMYTLDADDRVTYINEAGEKLLGWSRRELAGQVMHELTHYERADGEPFPASSCPIVKACTDGEVVRVDQDVFIRKDGTHLFVKYTSSPLRRREGVAGSVVVFSDISAQVEQERKAKLELEQVTWAGRVREALDKDGFEIHAQPIICLKSGETKSHELLIRMLDEHGAAVAPGLFLPAAEETGLITEVDHWMMRGAARIAAAGNPVHLNISAVSITEPELVGRFAAALGETGADASLITIELTETAVLANEAEAELFIDKMHQLGYRFALDDFGTGYGSFTYLKRLHVDLLKIDMEFVQDLTDNEASRHVVRAIVSLAHGFGQQTVAEGVEDEPTLQILQELGVDYAQGYEIGRPAPAREIFETGAD